MNPDEVAVPREVLAVAADALDDALAGKSQAFDVTEQMDIVRILRSLAGVGSDHRSVPRPDDVDRPGRAGMSDAEWMAYCDALDIDPGDDPPSKAVTCPRCGATGLLPPHAPDGTCPIRCGR